MNVAGTDLSRIAPHGPSPTAHPACPIAKQPQSKRLLPAMLAHSDLRAFVELLRRTERQSSPSPTMRPDTVLRSATPSDGLLHRNELARLRGSLKTASDAGDIPDSAHRVLHAIVQDLSVEGFCYLPLTHSKEWLHAIAWAHANQTTLASDHLPHPGQDGHFVVGTACRALRERGYRVDIGAHGPRIDDHTRTRIAQQVDSLVAQIGGIDAAEQLCRIIRETGKVHAGMWLLGNIPAGIGQPPQPAVPFGWLLSLALRHIHVRPSTGDPATAWISAVRLAIDFAASTNCQRYNQFDGFSLAAPDFLSALAESLTWRELFTLPQVPPSVLPTLRDAFSQIVWPEGTDVLRRDVDGLFRELNDLLETLSENRLTLMPKRTALSDFPLLWKHACAPRGAVNLKYLDPFGGRPRDHDRYVFFHADDDRVIVLPRSLTAAAACEAIFRLVRSKADPEPAKSIVADTIEKSVAIASRKTNTGLVWEKLSYREGKTNLEMDVAVRDGHEIVLFEAKAKSLTSESRTGDLMAFIDDYTKSFLAMLGQLVRHDRNIKQGLTPITGPDDDATALRITKIAVSPLSYGPASDHVLTNALIHSIADARLDSVQGVPGHVRILEDFNKSIARTMRIIDQIAPRTDGKVDMVRYLMGVSWFDLGQLLYALHRGRSLIDAVSALRHLTFSTRDFWTEAAFADRNALSERNWHTLPADDLTPD